MPDNSLEEIAKNLYKYIKTKEGKMPNMGHPLNQEALKHMFDNRYLIRRKYCSPKTTKKGDRWAYSK